MCTVDEFFAVSASVASSATFSVCCLFMQHANVLAFYASGGCNRAVLTERVVMFRERD